MQREENSRAMSRAVQDDKSMDETNVMAAIFHLVKIKLS
jgi:hypothetical protein